MRKWFSGVWKKKYILLQLEWNLPKRRGNVIYLTLENFLESDVGKRWTLGADQWRGEGGGIFYETFYHKILLRDGERGRGIWDSNWGYFIKIGIEIFLSLGLQLGLQGKRKIF